VIARSNESFRASVLVDIVRACHAPGVEVQAALAVMAVELLFLKSCRVTEPASTWH
jgi:hypothetical protein